MSGQTLAEVLAGHVLGYEEYCMCVAPWDLPPAERCAECKPAIEEAAAAVTAWIEERLTGAREEVAERLSLEEMTAYSPDAVEDHNRWSWRGDGHGEAVRRVMYERADKAVDAVREVLGIEVGS